VTPPPFALRFLARQFACPSGLAGRFLIGPWLDRIGRPMNRAAFEMLHARPGDRVLEVGFGGGELIEWLLSASEAEVVGVEHSEAMLERAKRRFRRALRDSRLQLLAGSVAALPIDDRSLDKAVSVNSLYFWADLPGALAEFSRALRPGGRLVLCFQTPEAVRAWPGHVHGFRAYGEDEVDDLMSAAGFSGVQTVSREAPEVGAFLCMSGERDDG